MQQIIDTTMCLHVISLSYFVVVPFFGFFRAVYFNVRVSWEVPSKGYNCCGICVLTSPASMLGFR